MSLAAAAPPASTREALAMLASALGYLAAADATQMPASEQAECLAGLERADAVETAARASILGGFTVAKGYCEDADYSPRAWLIHKTRITKVPPPVTSPGSAGPALIRGSPRPWPPRR
jgi:hypothetical protein